MHEQLRGQLRDTLLRDSGSLLCCATPARYSAARLWLAYHAERFLFDSP